MRKKDSRTEIANFRASKSESELYRRAGAITSKYETGEKSDVLRTGGTILAQNIVDIASGNISLEAALEQYKASLLDMLPPEMFEKMMSSAPRLYPGDATKLSSNNDEKSGVSDVP